MSRPRVTSMVARHTRTSDPGSISTTRPQHSQPQQQAAVAKQSGSAAAQRSRLSRTQWADVRRTARIARETGMQLAVQTDGTFVFAAVAVQRDQPAASAHSGMVKQPPPEADTAQPARPAVARGTSASPPCEPRSPGARTKRQLRSQQRLLDFQSKKRKLLISQSHRVRTFLKEFRWNRMQQVWTAWMRQQMQQKVQQLQQPQPQQQQQQQQPVDL